MEHQTAYRLRLLRTSVPACKSAHAGSIPASASILKTPQITVCGDFYWLRFDDHFRNFWDRFRKQPLYSVSWSLVTEGGGVPFVL